MLDATCFYESRCVFLCNDSRHPTSENNATWSQVNCWSRFAPFKLFYQVYKILPTNHFHRIPCIMLRLAHDQLYICSSGLLRCAYFINNTVSITSQASTNFRPCISYYNPHKNMILCNLNTGDTNDLVKRRKPFIISLSERSTTIYNILSGGNRNMKNPVPWCLIQIMGSYALNHYRKYQAPRPKPCNTYIGISDIFFTKTQMAKHGETQKQWILWWQMICWAYDRTYTTAIIIPLFACF